MEGYSRKDEACPPQLLDLIPKGREWLVKREEETSSSHGLSDEKNIELKLGPPGDQDWTIKPGSKTNSRKRDDHSLLSLGYFPNNMATTMTPKTMEDGWILNNNNGGQSQKLSSPETSKAVTVLSCPWPCTGYQVKTQQQQQQIKAPFLGLHSTQQGSLTVIVKESSQPCCTKVATDLQDAEKKSFSPVTANTAVSNSSQKRSAPTPVVGWPPIRSFRKNLSSSSSSKPSPESKKVVPNEFASEKRIETCRKGLLVKINMDGVPIGRKVDLKACDSYEKLSSAVDELFRGLLAVQSNSSAGVIHNKPEGEKVITGVLDGSGEYTLVYEDTEGDRMLVGDVPWNMFVSTVKRLRVLKSSELPTIFLRSKQEKLRQ